METMVPKLVAEDIPLLHSLLSDVFPGVKYNPAMMEALRREVKRVCEEMFLVYGEGDELGAMWIEKVNIICDSLCSLLPVSLENFTLKLDG
jgi:dynein heavy chain 1